MCVTCIQIYTIFDNGYLKKAPLLLMYTILLTFLLPVLFFVKFLRSIIAYQIFYFLRSMCALFSLKS